jgi:Cof subfamily protein (haloacid dehalogenase superfamily)
VYKLICLDMDGTLLNSEGQVSKRNINAVKAAHEKGVKVAVCTGRLFASARLYAELLEVKTPVITSNGAYIREKDRDDVIYKSVLGYENSMNILSVLKKYDVTFFYNSSEKVFMKKIDPDNAYARINNTLPKDKQITLCEVKDWEETFKENQDEILKCICVDKDISKIAEVKQELLKLDGIEVVSSLNTNFEIMNKGTSKGRAVEILAGFYDIASEEIMCIGDNENDISMIKYAGLGVAMGNGEDFVKQAADFVTDTNNNDGVAKAIEKFILS